MRALYTSPCMGLYIRMRGVGLYIVPNAFGDAKIRIFSEHYPRILISKPIKNNAVLWGNRAQIDVNYEKIFIIVGGVSLHHPECKSMDIHTE